MKICFYNVTAAYKSGGLETSCWEAGRSLSKRGHEVSIVAGSGGNHRYTDVKLIQFPFKERSIFPKFGTRFQKLMERLSFGYRAWRHMAGSNYDIVIINKPFDFPVLWWAKKRRLRAKVLFRSGGTDFFLGDKLFAGAIDFWASSSVYNAMQVERRYGHPVTVIHNGVDIERFIPADKNTEIRAHWGIPSGNPVIMSVGRLVGWKGLHTIVGLLPEVGDAHYVIVGEGPERESLYKLALHLNVSGRMHFLGAVAHSDLPRIISQADIFVQPSIGEEAFGISIVEAMSCGVPVLASRNGGMPEIVIDGKTGLLLPAGDKAAWKEAINTLLKQPDLLHEMGINARIRAEDHFSWSANALKLENLFMGGSL
ncbi:MAG: glycosyltransferase family 4 protein [Nitrospirae bacterium]|nr:glycosyltransferase family 4 protein [Nitrospirota bacterium]MCL5977097.1 glycosyltransferase family 4 protein [Nitrospirota bacterium]